VRIGLNGLKTMISISVTKVTPLCNCGKGRSVERWMKIMKNDGKYFD